MRCKAPSFWWSPPGMRATLLRPAAHVYQTISQMNKHHATPYKPHIPVICVGNVVAGGSGKTPAVQAISQLLHTENIARYPVILLRGYGGRLSGPTSVDIRTHDYKEVGDEALLHAAQVPTIIAHDRAAGVQLAQLSGADCVIMDDGLQNPSVMKHVSLLMIDAAQGMGNGLTLPAGPLRQPLDAALAQADGIILSGDALPFDTDLPVFHARIEATAVPDADKNYSAFAGLGRPEKFKQTLEAAGMRISEWHAFPDHYPYTPRDMERLCEQADKDHAQLITTAKDHVRVPVAYQGRVDILPVEMVFDDPAALLSFIKSKLPPR